MRLSLRYSIEEELHRQLHFFLIHWSFTFLLFISLALFFYLVFSNSLSTLFSICTWVLVHRYLSPCLGFRLTQNILTYLASVLIHGLQIAFSFYVWSKINGEVVWLFCYKVFWTQACQKGMGTNGTHRSHVRCHRYSIPQPVKDGHTTRVYVPYSFQTVVWVLLHPTRTDQWKSAVRRDLRFIVLIQKD